MRVTDTAKQWLLVSSPRTCGHRTYPDTVQYQVQDSSSQLPHGALVAGILLAVPSKLGAGTMVSILGRLSISSA